MIEHPSHRLSELLALRHPPVALTFVDQKPADLAAVTVAAPSACTFWRRAETETFYAAAHDHFNCPIGSLVMGFDLPATVTDELGGLVQSMCDAQYLELSEAAAIPHLATPSAGIVYGPLAQATTAPDLVLAWVDLAHAMLFNEASGTARWTATSADVTGRPGCAALPRAVATNSPSMSFGCIGMRTFTDIDDDLSLVAIPGGELEAFLEALEQTARANASMRTLYEAHREDVVG
ncbi:DUF169 domain-containing protein [Gordonia hydrophobica]|uniref:DUF169 domain-containing protein n=1 Tax=Gordonia hydrophobica TaxID=40516 RepID=A0ABZ2U5V1_9ACTN|nr:DUF169 domain-containing protein [Gordonia hydrophobica]MBM7365730.1 uncharacterized protein (DUF169 family) [Gordonia hydrophobica]